MANCPVGTGRMQRVRVDTHGGHGRKPQDLGHPMRKSLDPTGTAVVGRVASGGNGIAAPKSITTASSCSPQMVGTLAASVRNQMGAASVTSYALQAIE